MTNNSVISTIPANPNFLQTTKYIFSIPTLRYSNYFCQTVLMPSVATNEVLVPTPFSETYRHGDKLIYEPLVITFLVDEDMKSWEESYNWLQALTYPKEFAQYGKNSGHPLYHDGTLILNTNSNTSNFKVKFKNCHPTVLGSIQFETISDANVIPVADLTLRYDYFEFERVDN